MSLSKDVVLEAAVRLLDQAGLDALSTRRLADALGVRVGALYWHYPSKQALLDAIAERIIGEAATAADARPEGAAGADGGERPEGGERPDGDAWPEVEERLRSFAHALRGAMLGHPDGARIVAQMSAPGPLAREFIRLPVDALAGLGLSRADAESGADVVTSYTNGFTIEEQARKTSVDRARRDAGFDLGLTVIIQGLRARG